MSRSVPARDAEDVVDALAARRLDDQVAAGRQHAHRTGGCGVGVACSRPYLASMAVRIWVGVFPSCVARITSRVMSRQSVQVAAWLVQVVRSPDSALM
jgi:hypothetical protein